MDYKAIAYTDSQRATLGHFDDFESAQAAVEKAAGSSGTGTIYIRGGGHWVYYGGAWADDVTVGELLARVTAVEQALAALPETMAKDAAKAISTAKSRR